MIFGATKVTYNTYSCSMSGMSREMIKINGRDSAEYQIWEMRDITVILEKFKSLKDKRCIVLVFFIKPKKKRKRERILLRSSSLLFERILLERETSL